MTFVQRTLTAPGTPFYIRSSPLRRQPCATRPCPTHPCRCRAAQQCVSAVQLLRWALGRHALSSARLNIGIQGVTCIKHKKDQETLMAAPSAEVGRSDCGLVHRPSEYPGFADHGLSARRTRLTERCAAIASSPKDLNFFVRGPNGARLCKPSLPQPSFVFYRRSAGCFLSAWTLFPDSGHVQALSARQSPQALRQVFACELPRSRAPKRTS
jgi:hypothetical protein